MTATSKFSKVKYILVHHSFQHFTATYQILWLSFGHIYLLRYECQSIRKSAAIFKRLNTPILLLQSLLSIRGRCISACIWKDEEWWAVRDELKYTVLRSISSHLHALRCWAETHINTEAILRRKKAFTAHAELMLCLRMQVRVKLRHPEALNVVENLHSEWINRSDFCPGNKLLPLLEAWFILL